MLKNILVLANLPSTHPHRALPFPQPFVFQQSAELPHVHSMLQPPWLVCFRTSMPVLSQYCGTHPPDRSSPTPAPHPLPVPHPLNGYFSIFFCFRSQDGDGQYLQAADPEGLGDVPAGLLPGDHQDHLHHLQLHRLPARSVSCYSFFTYLNF